MKTKREQTKRNICFASRNDWTKKENKNKKKENCDIKCKNVNAKCFPYHFKKHMANDCKN